MKSTVKIQRWFRNTRRIPPGAWLAIAWLFTGSVLSCFLVACWLWIAIFGDSDTVYDRQHYYHPNWNDAVVRVSQSPDDPAAHLEMGMARFDRRQWAAARREYTIALVQISAEPQAWRPQSQYNELTAHLYLGRALDAAGNARAAQHEYQSVLSAARRGGVRDQSDMQEAVGEARRLTAPKNGRRD